MCVFFFIFLMILFLFCNRHKLLKDLKDEILKRHMNFSEMVTGLVLPLTMFYYHCKCTSLEFSCLMF